MGIYRYHREPDEQEEIVERRTSRRVPDDEGYVRQEVRGVPWSPAQVLALVLGIALFSLGGVVLATTGFEDIFDHVSVIGLHHTPLLGIIEIVTGVLLLTAGATPVAGRGMMTFVGSLVLAFGIVVAAQPSTFHDALGTHSVHGWLLMAIGGLVLIMAMVAPVLRRTVRTESFE